MREGCGRLSGVIALGLAAMLVQGCKQKVAPVAVQPVVRSTSRASGPSLSDFPPDDPPVADAKAPHQPQRHRVVVAQVDPAPQPVDDEAAEEAQQRRDATLLKQQEAASQRQQQELNGVVQQSLKIQQDQQAEPRIQNAPEPPPTWYSQPEDEQRIHDAPGPAQTNPTQTNSAPEPAQPQSPPQD
jgi:hypothetical protein